MLKAMLEERKASSQKRDGDFFYYVLDELKKESTVLTEEISLDLMFALLFASFVTTSLTLTMAIKLLTDHPHVLEKLRVFSTVFLFLYLKELSSYSSFSYSSTGYQKGFRDVNHKLGFF